MNDLQLSHPTPEKLAAFGLGKLAPEDSAAVESHIARCDSCCRRLEELPDDTLIGLLRDHDTRSELAIAGAEHDADAGAAKTSLQPDGGAAARPSEMEFDVADGIATDQTPDSASIDIPRELAGHPRYRIKRLLGRGGMGDVYLAEHRLMERNVAVKVINREMVDRPEAVRRFQREVKAAARLSHPNIVTAYDAEQAGDLHLLVMEYVEGRDLAHEVKERGPLGVARACDYIRQAALGLEHAHRCGMVHRDIKPQNLMLTPERQVKILDFGLARFASEAVVSGAPGGGPPQLTDARSMMGTPDYMAPEQARNAARADIRSDIYSLGATLYFLLAGRPLFAGRSVMERLRPRVVEELPPLSEVRDDVPEEVVRILKRMTAKDPAQRYQTPAEVAEALAPFADAKQPPARPRSRRRAVLPAVLVGLAAAAVLALVAIFTVATDRGTLEIRTYDEDAQVEVINDRPLKPGTLRKFAPAEKPITRDGVTAEEGGWRIDAREKRTVRLFEVPKPGVEDCTLAYRAKIKTKGLKGKAYLEMWCRLPGRGEFFSKDLSHAVSGTTDWASCEAPFLLEKGQRPDLVKLNLVVEGKGTVWIKDIELLKAAR